VMVFAVVGRIGQNLIQDHTTGRLDQRGGKVRCVVAWTPTDLSGEPQMAWGVAGDRELGVIGIAKDPGIRPLGKVVEAGLADLESGRVDRAALSVADQAALSTLVASGVKQSIETPFFRRRL
jgi:hypothetical protein